MSARASRHMEPCPNGSWCDDGCEVCHGWGFTGNQCLDCTWRNNAWGCAMASDEYPCPGWDDAPCKRCGMSPCACEEFDREKEWVTR